MSQLIIDFKGSDKLIIEHSLNTSPKNSLCFYFGNQKFICPVTLEGFEKIDELIHFFQNWKKENINKLLIAEELRTKYLSLLQFADLTDSKIEDQNYRKQAKEILEKLIANCPHSDVVKLNDAVPEYSALDQCFPALPEERKCLMCGTCESQYSSNSFKLLTNFIWTTKSNYNKKTLKYEFLPEINNPLLFTIENCRYVVGG